MKAMTLDDTSLEGLEKLLILVIVFAVFRKFVPHPEGASIFHTFLSYNEGDEYVGEKL
ncbi:MAG TPA: hypothetical protein PKY10_05685 [Lentisphaeria bacterium]|nr:hypothetical protein [Lentisphaeria bacterium]